MPKSGLCLDCGNVTEFPSNDDFLPVSKVEKSQITTATNLPEDTLNDKVVLQEVAQSNSSNLVTQIEQQISLEVESDQLNTETLVSNQDSQQQDLEIIEDAIVVSKNKEDIEELSAVQKIESAQQYQTAENERLGKKETQTISDEEHTEIVVVQKEVIKTNSHQEQPKLWVPQFLLNESIEPIINKIEEQISLPVQDKVLEKPALIENEQSIELLNEPEIENVSDGSESNHSHLTEEKEFLINSSHDDVDKENTVDDIEESISPQIVNPLPKKRKKLILPFAQGNVAKLEVKRKKIILSCENVLEQLKGKLISKGNHYQKIMVTSAHSQDGVTTSAIAVAVGLARYGQSSVLLIDSNSESRGLTKAFSLGDASGFYEYMAAEDSIEATDVFETIASATKNTSQSLAEIPWAQSVFYTEYKNLYVMPFAKEKNVSVWDLVEKAGFEDRLLELSHQFDFIIIDTPAVMKSSEAQILASFLDGVIFVVKAEKTKWEVAKIALDMIENSGGKVIGSILNRREFYIPKFLYGWM